MDKEKSANNLTDSKDCLECRLLSGFGVIGIAVYLFHQAQHRKKLEKRVLTLISAGAFLTGTARLLDLNFLKYQRTNR